MKVLFCPTSTLRFTEEFIDSFINDPQFYEDLKFGMTYRDCSAIIERAIAFPLENAVVDDAFIAEIPDGVSYDIKIDGLGGEYIRTYLVLTQEELSYGLDKERLSLVQQVDYLLYEKKSN